jgi:hypothetical protein
MGMKQESDDKYDPLYRSSLREMKWILGAWIVNCVWVVGYCGWTAFDRGEGNGSFLMGMPTWVFYGVFVPWIAVTLFTTWFALGKMEDHSLEDSEND